MIEIKTTNDALLAIVPAHITSLGLNVVDSNFTLEIYLVGGQEHKLSTPLTDLHKDLKEVTEKYYTFEYSEIVSRYNHNYLEIGLNCEPDIYIDAYLKTGEHLRLLNKDIKEKGRYHKTNGRYTEGKEIYEIYDMLKGELE